CSGESSESARPQPQCNECPPSDSGASVRHNEVLDGSNTLSHEKAAKGSHRDGAERPRLQYEACDDDPGRGRIAGGDAGVGPAFRATKAAPKLRDFHTAWARSGHSRPRSFHRNRGISYALGEPKHSQPMLSVLNSRIAMLPLCLAGLLAISAGHAFGDDEQV